MRLGWGARRKYSTRGNVDQLGLGEGLGSGFPDNPFRSLLHPWMRSVPPPACLVLPRGIYSNVCLSRLSGPLAFYPVHPRRRFFYVVLCRVLVHLVPRLAATRADLCVYVDEGCDATIRAQVGDDTFPRYGVSGAELHYE